MEYRLNTRLLLNFVHRRVYQKKARDPKFNQDSLAKLANLSHAAFSRAINGNKITITTLEKILNVLRIPKTYMNNIFISKNGFNRETKGEAK